MEVDDNKIVTRLLHNTNVDKDDDVRAHDDVSLVAVDTHVADIHILSFDRRLRGGSSVR